MSFALTAPATFGTEVFGAGAGVKGGALDAGEVTDRFVDEQGGVGEGVVAEDVAPSVSKQSGPHPNA